MTEVPEYLLERSRARRAALGLGTGDAPASDDGGSAPSAAPAVASSAPSAPAAQAGAPASGAGGAPAPAASATETLPAYVPDAGPKSGIPVWMMPVILIVPLWAIVYMGAFAEQKSNEPLTGVALGAQIYTSAGCGGCHGARGQGGVGPALAAGEVALTFPDMEAHVEFVKQGSGAIRGQPYGDPGRPGGQHVASSGGMPAFGTQLSDDEIRAVVQYEREGL